MITHDLHRFPDPIDYAHGEISVLDEYDLEEAMKNQICEIWYWYACGDYEGMGQSIVRKAYGDGAGRKNNWWSIHSLSHCSCYGPLNENMNDLHFFEDPEEMFDQCSEHLKGEMLPLMEMVRKSEEYSSHAEPEPPESMVDSILDLLLGEDL
jgi:hypothetical protein